ncbi:MAG: ABC transporter ATP-binding protein [Bacilli bacterium]
MNVVEVNNLCKIYPKFELKNVSFTLEKSKITGFIGRNGAGKTTTLKSLMNLIHKNSGEILFFGQDFENNEEIIKQKIGFVLGEVNYYSNKKLNTITRITKLFYENWDDDAYIHYMKMFNLDGSKTPSQLSAGMKVKYSIALALSHNAEILILDEPTSGLDPVSRDEVLDIFMNLSNSGVTILFSTHIITDLDKCADNIIYIKEGKIIADTNVNDFVNSYRILTFKTKPQEAIKPILIGLKPIKNGYSALIKTKDCQKFQSVSTVADLESIMIHIEREEF